MKTISKISAIMLTGALLFTACGNKEQKGNEAMNENASNEKIKVVEVEGRKNFSDQAVITPLPAIMIATWDKDNNPDVMMAAWGGQCGPKHITFQLSAHKTTENIRLKKAFTISFATKDDIAQSDYFGIVSANEVPDKVAKAGFTITKSPNVDAPIINEYKLTLECKCVTFDEDDRGGARVVGEIVNMSADESILDEDGKIDLGKLQPVIFDSAKREYRVVGEKVGNAWGAGKSIINSEVK
ncbi:flavin reductase [Prevotella sp. E9-3]|uniref:flavin reductase family protein n=1 Tax=Prevotella sp. E9-3 TaxID=2913621 RepID=UPI001EDC5813|nr:flavin reductase [Prevotella sp. E9-3]UKK49326.1 flavin reductase [Prevotella sp. E9-3]